MLFEGEKGKLREADVPRPEPAADEVLLRVSACAVCRTDLHIVDGELTEPKLPLIPGHQVVGTVERAGESVTRFRAGDRVGVPWLGRTCGTCRFCRDGKENLCERAQFTGYTIDGGYAEFAVASEDYCFPVPEGFDDLQAAPLLCGGLIGYRAYRMTGDARRIGFYGFGSAAHMLCQAAVHQDREIYAFTREGDREGQDFARRLGAVWAGASGDSPPQALDAAIIFAPVGKLVPRALEAVVPGGVVVCAGIHMSDIPSFPYKSLWRERVLRSVANLTRRDGEEFLALAAEVPVRTEVKPYPLEKAQSALDDLREGRLSGSAVLRL